MQCPDPWYWVAHYSDGTQLCEYDDDGQHGWKEIDQSKLTAFELVPLQEGLVHHILKVSADSRPIFFRRRTISVNINGEVPVETGRDVFHVVGFQKTFGKGKHQKSYKCFVFIFQDGSTILTDDSEHLFDE